jgi:hypothetical protein
MTGLSGLGRCSCLHMPDDWGMHSLSGRICRTCCDGCGTDNDCCSSHCDRTGEPHDDRYTPESRFGDRHSSDLEPASDDVLRIETRPHLPYSPPASGLSRVLPHLSTTILLI